MAHYLALPMVTLTHDHLTKPHLKNPNLCTKFPFSALQFTSCSSRSVKLRSKPNNEKVDPFEYNKDGDDKSVVDDIDMEGYLNSLSLEYDSVWDTKPSWCQPWTIGLTGVSVIACSWLVLHSVVVTVLASTLISAWWYIFLYSYPKSYSDMIAERRKRMSGGLEDTYGSVKNQ